MPFATGVRTMIEGLTNIMAPKAISTQESDGELESAALLGAAAIQRLVAERDDFRRRITSQQRELVALSAINEDLRGRIALIRHHYVELGTKILAQLEQFDDAFREVAREAQEKVDNSTEQANLVALAQRLRPPSSRHARDRGD
jgi:predicted  nucleic acid-binding Zn-ribbon protein